MAAKLNLQAALEKAGADFAAADPGAMAVNAQVEYNNKEAYFTVPFLGRNYRVYHPGGLVEPVDVEGNVPPAHRIVLLHYLVHCGPREVEGAAMSYRELPGGSSYIGPFTDRTVKPLVAIFGDKPALLVEAAQKLGGAAIDLGDTAVTVPVLPKIPITFILWAGDDEFPASGNVLFDVSASAHLHTEDYALLPGLAIWEMKRLAGL
ncbi:MAG: DUF3786 domain-containing protein [Firmicutes bacterium]|nr:DUF3786 domain-containing protein [Bacillota bacterium]